MIFTYCHWIGLYWYIVGNSIAHILNVSTYLANTYISSRQVIECIIHFIHEVIDRIFVLKITEAPI